MNTEVVRIALLGAECTGKTSLSLRIAQTLQSLGLSVTVVPEVLREWCDAQGRTPLQHEQAAIAQQQAQRTFDIDSGWVIADTSPLMTAIYSDFIFQDKSLYPEALAYQAQFDLTLVMGLDIAWVPDGLQRDGAHVREPIDAMLRESLRNANIPFKVIYGQHESRLDATLMAIQEGIHALRADLGLRLASFKSAQSQREGAQFGLNQGKTAWRCDLCSDADCEHRLFSDLLQAKGSVN